MRSKNVGRRVLSAVLVAVTVLAGALAVSSQATATHTTQAVESMRIASAPAAVPNTPTTIYEARLHAALAYIAAHSGASMPAENVLMLALYRVGPPPNATAAAYVAALQA